MSQQESVDAGRVLVAALHTRAAEIRRAEIARARRRLAPEQCQAVDALLGAIVSRLLDAPAAAIEELGREGRAASSAPAVRSVLGLS